MRRPSIFRISGIACIALVLIAGAQAQKPAFVSVSVKASPPGSRLRDMSRGNRLALSGAPLRILLRYAYPNFLQSQFTNVPGWVDTDLFDVDARADCEGISEALMAQLVQSLLEDRFRLTAHIETRELPTYELTVARGGAKIKLSEDQSVVPPRPPCAQAPRPGGDAPSPAASRLNTPPRGLILVMRSISGSVQLSGTAVLFSNFVASLQRQENRLIVDKTGLTGLFDIRFEYLPDAVITSDPAPTLSSALQQLGLRLESAKGPVQVLVVDSVSKPTEN